jgi:hypothetical protein
VATGRRRPALCGLAAIALPLLRGDDMAGLWAMLFLFATSGSPISPPISSAVRSAAQACTAYLARQDLERRDRRRAGRGNRGLLIAMPDRWSDCNGFRCTAACPFSVVAQLRRSVRILPQAAAFGQGFQQPHPGHGGVMDRVDSLVAAAIGILCPGRGAGRSRDRRLQAFFAARLDGFRAGALSIALRGHPNDPGSGQDGGSLDDDCRRNIRHAGTAVRHHLVPFLFVLTVVVFVHEMGHYLVGRWCGIGVRAFSIGFGPELFGFTDARHALEAFGHSSRRLRQVRRRHGVTSEPRP